MLVISDLHGNYNKAKYFLEYKPNEEKCVAGDIFDSYHATNEEIIRTAKLIFESNILYLSGNHCNQYFNNSTRSLQCSGFRSNHSFIHMMEIYKDKIQASFVIDDYIITHGGISKGLIDYIGTDLSNEDLSNIINKEFNDFKNSPVINESLSPIFNISKSRGGRDMYSGSFWADYRMDEMDIFRNQIFGHNHSKSGPKEIIDPHTKTKMICVDCPQYVCFNTKTNKFEDFFPYKLNIPKDMLERTY